MRTQKIIWVLALLLITANVNADSKPIETNNDPLVKELPSSQSEEELLALDEVIEHLTELRDKELAKAARAKDQGDRLQFKSDNLSDARRFWNKAEANKEIAARYQEEIDKLVERKNKLDKKK